jgi:protein CpxP
MTSVYKSLRNRLLVAGLLASMGLAAMAQTPPPEAKGGPMATQGVGHPMHGDKVDPAKMEARHNEHLAKLKAKLKLTAAQEPAWTSFTATMKPPMHSKAEHDAMQADMAKLTTPERIDKMQAHKAERDADMSQRAEATKAFYAQLSAEQKKVFDTETARHMHAPHGDMGHGMGH